MRRRRALRAGEPTRPGDRLATRQGGLGQGAGSCAATSPMAKKDYTTAENEYKQAASQAPLRPITGRCSPIFTAAASAGPIWTTRFRIASPPRRKAKHTGVALYDGAGVLIAANRNPSLAAQMLENYLSGLVKDRGGSRIYRPHSAFASETAAWRCSRRQAANLPPHPRWPTNSIRHRIQSIDSENRLRPKCELCRPLAKAALAGLALAAASALASAQVSLTTVVELAQQEQRARCSLAQSRRAEGAGRAGAKPRCFCSLGLVRLRPSGIP